MHSSELSIIGCCQLKVGFNPPRDGFWCEFAGFKLDVCNSFFGHKDQVKANLFAKSKLVYLKKKIFAGFVFGNNSGDNSCHFASFLKHTKTSTKVLVYSPNIVKRYFNWLHSSKNRAKSDELYV